MVIRNNVPVFTCIYRINNLLVILFLYLACRARVDLAFVIDGSGSIEAYGKGNFRRCLNFVKAIVSRFNIGNGQTRIGIVLYSSRPRLIFDFRRYRRKSQILNAINRIRYPRGGTKTGYAMRYCYSRVFRYARRGVRKVSLVGLPSKNINFFYQWWLILTLIMLNPDYYGIWRSSHWNTCDVSNLHIRGATIDLFPGFSTLYIDCILTELIVKTWSVLGAKLLVTQANIPIINHWLRPINFSGHKQGCEIFPYALATKYGIFVKILL